MRSRQLLKALFLCTPLLWLSCSSWEEVASPDEFGPLKISSVSPMSVHAGDNIIITGENFIENKEFDQVWFGGNIRGNVDSATMTQLFLKVPEGAQTGALSVSNGMNADTLKSAFTVTTDPDTPNEIEFTPSTGYAGSGYIRIHGFNFGKIGDSVDIQIGNGKGKGFIDYQDLIRVDVIPINSTTGTICVTNSKGKKGCSKQEFIIKNNGLSKCSYSFNGIKIKRSIYSSWRSNGTIDSKSSFDTVIENNTISFQRSYIPSAESFIAIGGCLRFPEGSQIPAPYPDSILQFYKNSGSTHNFKAIKCEIDSIQKIIKVLKIIDIVYSSSSSSYPSSNEKDCTKRIMEFKNVSFEKANNKILIKLNADLIKQTLTQYTFYKESSWANNPGGNWGNNTTETIGIHEILPDAYFELTLE